VAFRTEELSTQVFPSAGEGLWACPESTIFKKDPCPQSTHVPPPGPQPCPAGTHPGGGNPCPESTISPTTHPPRRASAGTLPLLQAQLRERLASPADLQTTV
jgi:hypothetical protein